jgi:hypothetical protein
MSKFDAILRRLEEQTPGLTTTVTASPTGAQPTSTQPLNPQSLQQAAKILNIDPKALETLLQQQKQAQTGSKPPVPPVPPQAPRV